MPYTGSRLMVRFTAKGERRFISSTEVEKAYTVHTPASSASHSQSEPCQASCRPRPWVK